jgi:phosphoglycolate phosphatase
MSVATNKPSYFAWRLLEGLLVRRYLTTVLGPDLVQNRKPHPEMVIKAMAKMTVAARETLYVGDMEIDVETARRAGIPVAVVPTGSRTEEALRQTGADLLLGSFRDLLEYLPGVTPSHPPAPASA